MKASRVRIKIPKSKGAIVYYPILPKKGEPGAKRSKDVRKWLYVMRRAGIVTRKESEANAYLVVGGDGMLMDVARKKFGKGKIIVGINRGTVGFMLNQIADINDIPLQFSQLTLVTIPLIKGEFFLKGGGKKEFLAVNDIVVGGDVSDYIRFNIKGSLSGFRERDVTGNGIIVSTPQGTTGYPLKIQGGGAILPLRSDNWKVIGLATGPFPNVIATPQAITISAESRSKVSGYADGKRQVAEDVERVVVTPTKYFVTLGFTIGDFEARRSDLAEMVERGML